MMIRITLVLALFLSACASVDALNLRGMMTKVSTAMSTSSGGCPLCEAFGTCLKACAEHRHENQPDWQHVNYSYKCLKACGNAVPGQEIPTDKTAFDGPSITPESESHAWFSKMSAELEGAFTGGK